MRNASKKTIKRIMRRAYDWANGKETQWNLNDESNYYLFNNVGAQVYRMSKGKICNREPRGYEKYYKK